MSVIPTKEDVLRHVQTMLENLFVVAKMDTLLQAMATHVMVWTDLSTSVIFCKIISYTYILVL